MAEMRSGRRTPRAKPGKAPGGREVLARVEKGEFQPVYVLLGEDRVLADSILARLKEKALEPGLEAFDFEMLDAEDFNDDDFQQRLRQLPVGARRLVVIKDITRMGREGPVFPQVSGKSGIEELCRTVARIQDPKSKTRTSTIVVLTGLASRDLGPLLTKAGLGRFVVDLGQPGHRDLTSLVQGWAKELGISVTTEAAELLVDISGEDTGTLKGEVEKLATCLPRGTRVSPEAVREQAGSSRAFELREYVSLILKRDAAGALDVLRRLEAAGEGIPHIVAWLTTAFLDLVAARGKVLPYYAARRLGDAPDRWRDTNELNAMLQQLYRVQRSMFEGKPEPFARLELLTHCVGCGTRTGWCDLYKDRQHWQSCLRSRRRNHG